MTKSSMNSFTQKEQIDPKILAQWTSKKQDSRTIVVFGILSIFFTVFGLIFVIAGSKIKEVNNKYSDNSDCGVNKTCTISIDIKDKMESPVYFYYGLNNFYQNHQRYTDSKDGGQLGGAAKTVGELSKCHPIITNDDAGVTTSVTGAPLTPTDPAIPCGLIAHTLFTDTFTLTDPSSTAVPISTDGIAWDVDVKSYKNVDTTKQWADMEDPRFINWMRIAGLNRFRKLWGVINQDLEPGTYTVTINNFPPSYKFYTELFQSDKSFIITTINSFGAQNLFLSICFLIAAGGAWVMFIIFVVRMIRNRRRKLQ